ncbi:MAG TPA: CBS domain-containing protein, partial [Methylomirabilota bacterium]|nr:CBS domain-containing protein [Methylomirabilota bacterium]
MSLTSYQAAPPRDPVRWPVIRNAEELCLASSTCINQILPGFFAALSGRPRDNDRVVMASDNAAVRHTDRLLPVNGVDYRPPVVFMYDAELLVIGHRNPDTDAICSAIGYAEFKRRTGAPHAVAARCGDTNARTDFVLQTFGVPAPRFVADVSPKVRDVMASQVISVPPTATVAEALAVMDERNIRVLPVLGDDGTCQGLISVFKMTKFFLPARGRLPDSRRVLASVASIARATESRVVVSVKPEVEEDLILMIGAMNLESFTRRLENYPREKLLVIVGDRL